MITKELTDYITAQLARGVSAKAISDELSANGWTPDDIARAIAAVSTPLVPVVPAATVIPATPLQITPVQTATAQQVLPPAQIQPQTTPLSQKKSLVPVAVTTVVVLLVICAAGAGWFYWQNVQEPATALVQPEPIATTTPSVPAQIPAPLPRFTFTPTTSVIPAFSFAYTASSTATSTQSARSTRISLFAPDATSSMLDIGVSLFPNPLDPAQTPEVYLQATFKEATVTSSVIQGRTIAKIESPAFPAGQTLYYVFLKNGPVITLRMSGDLTDIRDALVASIQFEDPKY